MVAQYPVWIILPYIGGLFRFAICDEFYDLQEKLFFEYDPGIRPHCGPDRTTRVKIDVALRQILFLNEPTQEIKIKVWMRLYWDDCRLTWNATEVGTDTLYLPQHRVWIPDIALFDSTQDVALPGIKDYRAQINHDGSIQYQWPTVITSYCKLNVRNFPLDSQICEFIFASWLYNGLEVDILSVKYDGYADKDTYQENAEWKVKKYYSKRTVTYYNCCEYPFTDMRFFLHIQRRHLNYIVTLVFPCLLISFLPLLGFLLPVNYGEKVSLQVTMMLSLCVFLMVIATSLPPSSEAMPLIGIYFVCSLSLVAISCIVTVGVINIHFKLKKPVQPWVKKFIIGKIGRLFCVESDLLDMEESLERAQLALMTKHGCEIYFSLNNASQSMSIDGKQESDEAIYILRVVKQLQSIEKRSLDNEIEKTRANEWHVLAKIVDRFFFMLCFIFLITVLVVVFPQPE